MTPRKRRRRRRRWDPLQAGKRQVRLGRRAGTAAAAARRPPRLAARIPEGEEERLLLFGVFFFFLPFAFCPSGRCANAMGSLRGEDDDDEP